MSNLIEVVQSVKAEFKINANGQVTVSIIGASRLIGVADTSIVRGSAFASKEMAEMLANAGFQSSAEFSKNGIPDTALAIIAQYFAFKSKRKTPEAQELCMAFMAIGIRAWVHEQLGWTKSTQPSQQSKPILQAYSRRVNDIHNSVRDLPDGYWCIFVEAAQLLIYVENQLGYLINEYDLLDGSIGRRWSNYRKKQSWAGTVKTYTYQFPVKRDKQTCNCYPNSELLEFREWLEKQYKAKHLADYLQRKYSTCLVVA